MKSRSFAALPRVRSVAQIRMTNQKVNGSVWRG